MEEPSGKRRSEWRAALQYAGLGFQFVAAIALGYWGGGWAGRRWGWARGEEIGLGAGFVIGLWMLVKAGIEWDKRDKRGPGSSS